jgi:peptidoglycan/xylan/chitin deacetylase (PgdA/CDA1 family)
VKVESNKDVGSERPSLSIAERVGLVSFLMAILLLFFEVWLSVIPLAGFLLLCIAAPFFPRFGFYLPVISRGRSGKKAVALTFDDGPDPVSTPELLRLLSKHKMKATFFVTGTKASEHPELVKEIALHGHAIGNHTNTHDNLILFRSHKRLLQEIASTQNVLGELGIITRAFRPPVGITGPRLLRVLSQLGLDNVNFRCRAFDGGNRWIMNLSKKILKRIRPDDIVLLHDVRPKNNALFSYWLNEIERILSGIEAKGFTVLPLSALIGRPVMISKPERPKKNIESITTP